MKFWNLSNPLLLVIAFSLFFSACEKEKVNNDDKNYPIQLTVTKPDRKVILEWTKTDISNFDSYVLVRSTEPIDDLPEPVGVFQTIDDFEENTFEDTSFPLTEEVYYKVYVKVGDRFLFSPTVSIQFDVNLLDLRATKTVFDKEGGRLFMYDNTQRKIFRYDLEADEAIEFLEDQTAFDIIMAVGDAGEGTELYVNRNTDNQLKIYDAETLDFKENFSGNANISSIEVGEGVFILATNNFGGNVSIYDRLTKSLIESVSVSQGFDRRIKLMPGNERVLVETSFEDVVRYTFNSSWQLDDVASTFFFSNPLSKIEASPDGAHFIPNLEGTVFDLDLNNDLEISSPSIQFAQDYLFSADGTKVYAFNFSPGQVVEFSFPEVEELRTIDLSYNPVNAFLSKDGEVVVVGFVSDGFTQKTYVDILEL